MRAGLLRPGRRLKALEEGNRGRRLCLWRFKCERSRGFYWYMRFLNCVKLLPGDCRRDSRRRKLRQQRLGRHFRRRQSSGAKRGCCGLRAGDKARQHSAIQQMVPAHDVSIRMTATDGARYRGCIPGSKNSMTIMRPPQQGHGGKTVSAGSSWLGLALA